MIKTRRVSQKQPENMSLGPKDGTWWDLRLVHEAERPEVWGGNLRVSEETSGQHRTLGRVTSYMKMKWKHEYLS